MKLEVEHIDGNLEDMNKLIRTLNERFDSIALAVNTQQPVENNTTVGQQNEVFLDTVSKRVRAKNIKFGSTNAATVKNSTLFVDASDGGLKFKDSGGAVTVIVP
jgi:hypothetical protein